MLSAFISSLRTVDLRRKILFTLGIVVLYRLGAALPSPGVNFPNVQQCIKEASGGGVNYSLDCTGIPAVIGQAIASTSSTRSSCSSVITSGISVRMTLP